MRSDTIPKTRDGVPIVNAVMPRRAESTAAVTGNTGVASAGRYRTRGLRVGDVRPAAMDRRMVWRAREGGGGLVAVPSANLGAGDGLILLGGPAVIRQASGRPREGRWCVLAWIC